MFFCVAYVSMFSWQTLLFHAAYVSMFTGQPLLFFFGINVNIVNPLCRKKKAQCRKDPNCASAFSLSVDSTLCAVVSSLYVGENLLLDSNFSV